MRKEERKVRELFHFRSRAFLYHEVTTGDKRKLEHPLGGKYLRWNTLTSLGFGVEDTASHMSVFLGSNSDIDDPDSDSELVSTSRSDWFASTRRIFMISPILRPAERRSSSLASLSVSISSNCFDQNNIEVRCLLLYWPSTKALAQLAYVPLSEQNGHKARSLELRLVSRVL